MWALPGEWDFAVGEEIEKPYFRKLRAFVDEERAAGREIAPKPEDMFRAFKLCKFEDVRVVILGREPHHKQGLADGLSFSVSPGCALTPSLRNMFKELEHDLGMPPPVVGCLDDWARQGVLLINEILTVEAGRPCSHKGRGWELFTDAVLKRINDDFKDVVFLLWGGDARKKASSVDIQRHHVLKAGHPSAPSTSSAKQGLRFVGCGHFSKATALLRRAGRKPIDWAVIAPGVEVRPTEELLTSSKSSSPIASRAARKSPPKASLPPVAWEAQWEAIRCFRRGKSAPIAVPGVDAAALAGGGAKKERFETLVALVLGTQTPHDEVRAAMDGLRHAGLSAENLAKMDMALIADLIHSVPFAGRKAASLHDCAKICLEKYGGDVPDTLEAARELPGVGPKTANLLLQTAWNKVEGIAVTSNVHRVAKRLGWADRSSMDATMAQLQTFLPRQDWRDATTVLGGFGEEICTESEPACHGCPVRDSCPRLGLLVGEGRKQ